MHASGVICAYVLYIKKPSYVSYVYIYIVIILYLIILYYIILYYVISYHICTWNAHGYIAHCYAADTLGAFRSGLGKMTGHSGSTYSIPMVPRKTLIEKDWKGVGKPCKISQIICWSTLKMSFDDSSCSQVVSFLVSCVPLPLTFSLCPWNPQTLGFLPGPSLLWAMWVVPNTKLQKCGAWCSTRCGRRRYELTTGGPMGQGLQMWLLLYCHAVSQEHRVSQSEQELLQRLGGDVYARLRKNMLQ